MFPVSFRKKVEADHGCYGKTLDQAIKLSGMVCKSVYVEGIRHDILRDLLWCITIWEIFSKFVGLVL